MLKKFTEFISEKKCLEDKEKSLSSKSIPTEKIEKSVKKEEIKPIEKPIEKVEEKPLKKEVEKPIKENILFEGKIVKFPHNTKPSIAYRLLEDKNVSKNKLHYIISDYNTNCISIVKYNQEAPIKLLEFVNTILNVYSKNSLLKESLKNIQTNGDNNYVRIENIPIKFIEIMNKDLIKLLSK